MPDDIRPGDLVSYDGDERIIWRYVGPSRIGHDVVETTYGQPIFNCWLPGKMRLYQADWSNGEPIRRRSDGG